jgi:uncharacterized repeat protein (TIGR01451 family)
MSFFAFLDFTNSHSSQENTHSKYIITRKSKFYKIIVIFVLQNYNLMKTKLLFLVALVNFSLFSFAQNQNQNPNFTIGNAQTFEGSPLVFPVTLNVACSTDVVMNFTITDGSGMIIIPPIVIAIPAGANSTTLNVPTTVDNLIETNEIIIVTGAIISGCFADPNAPNTGTGTIIDNNSFPTVSISTPDVLEGNIAVFSVDLSNPSSFDTIITVITVEGDATNLDFTPITNPITITIPAGFLTGSTTVAVPTIMDTLIEGNHTFQLCGTIVSGNTANINPCGTATIFENNNGIIATEDFCNGLAGTLACNVTFNDTLFGVPVTPENTDVVPSNDQFLSIDSEGNVMVAPNTPIGSYVLNYTICSVGTPPVCDTAFVVVSVQSNAFISLSISSAYNDFNNDGFTNVGDVINYQYTVTNTGQVPLTNAQVFYMQSPLPSGPIPILAVGASDNTTYSYSYILTQADINAGLVYTSAYVTAEYNGQQIANDFGLQTQLSISDGIKFNLFFDTNGNGIQNAGEQNYNGGVFTYQLNSGQLHSVTSSDGMFILYENNPANLYTIGCTLSSNNNYCNGQYALSTSSYNNVSVTNGSGITTYNFPITTAPCTDLSVSLYNYGAPPRPGFQYSNVIYYKNYGNQTISSGAITFTKDNAISITSTSPVTTATANGFTYNFANLLPNEERYIYVYMQVPVIPTVSLGQLVANSVTTTIPSGDMNVANNASTLTQTIVGSWDPNDKTESHGEKIVHSTFSSNEYLTYTIRFENTGTAEAINIRVNDVLDSQLDENSIRMVNASHPYVLDKVGSTLNCKFDGVNLPPSVANTQIGHGYIVFQVKPKAGFAVGDIIPNTANIYFDFNPAIVTNTVTTEFVTTLAINEFDTNSVSIYPNPVHANLNLTNSSKIDFVEVISVLGQKVLIQNVNDFDTKINMGSLEKGIYFVKVISQGKEKTIKIIKE